MTEEKQFLISEFPSDFVPKEGQAFIAVDHATPGSDCTVKGFYDRVTGAFHIQDIIFANP